MVCTTQPTRQVGTRSDRCHQSHTPQDADQQSGYTPCRVSRCCHSSSAYNSKVCSTPSKPSTNVRVASVGPLVVSGIFTTVKSVGWDGLDSLLLLQKFQLLKERERGWEGEVSTPTCNSQAQPPLHLPPFPARGATLPRVCTDRPANGCVRHRCVCTGLHCHEKNTQFAKRLQKK